MLFAVGLMDPDAFVQSEEQQRRREEERENNAIREREIDASPERRQSIDMGTGRAAETPVEGEHAAGSLDTPGEQGMSCLCLTLPSVNAV